MTSLHVHVLETSAVEKSKYTGVLWYCGGKDVNLSTPPTQYIHTLRIILTSTAPPPPHTHTQCGLVDFTKFVHRYEIFFPMEGELIVYFILGEAIRRRIKEN